MLTEQDESGNIPTHDENANRHSHNGKADGRNIPQVLWRKEQGIGTKAFHEATVDDTKHEEPEKQDELILSKVEEDQLDG